MLYLYYFFIIIIFVCVLRKAFPFNSIAIWNAILKRTAKAEKWSKSPFECDDWICKKKKTNKQTNYMNRNWCMGEWAINAKPNNENQNKNTNWTEKKTTANHNTSSTALSPIEIVCSFFSSNTSKRIASNKNLPKKANTTALLLLWVCRAAPLNVYTPKRAWFFFPRFFPCYSLYTLFS